MSRFWSTCAAGKIQLVVVCCVLEEGPSLLISVLLIDFSMWGVTVSFIRMPKKTGAAFAEGMARHVRLLSQHSISPQE